jgi:hypothetical protein
MRSPPGQALATCGGEEHDAWNGQGSARGVVSGVTIKIIIDCFSNSCNSALSIGWPSLFRKVQTVKGVGQVNAAKDDQARGANVL